ncbi:AbgT family transporter [Streptomyces samsunensis]|uniref:AbgT family transporter n=1 Tax=Streptomyces malaysiensis subsp. samsunensis TaxID=459658 RepID=A0A9X2RTF0_STRMQ|nr:AbgT family transporter [Streptomyces samsunensis]
MCRAAHVRRGGRDPDADRSGSALWSLVGPVFIPAFMLMDMSPALSQAAFRIGDSATGAITPMNPYLLLVLAMVREYEPEAHRRHMTHPDRTVAPSPQP